MITYNSQRTHAPELNLPGDTAKIIFVNYFDYTVPRYIKDKQEITYSYSVSGFSKGLAERFAGEPLVKFRVADTLARRHTVMSMQDIAFKDTVRAMCKKHNAGLLIALDSINVWMDENIIVDEENSTTSEYYLYSSNYVSLYSSGGDVIERSTAERSKFYKSRPAFLFGLITFTPSLTRAADDAAALSEGAGEDYAGKFFPVSENVYVNLYSGKYFNESNRYITGGNPVKAIEPLRQLTGSPKKGIARKAAHNLSIVYEIMEDRRASGQVLEEFRKR